MAKTIKFDPKAKELKVRVEYSDKVSSTYTVRLWGPNRKVKLCELEGNFRDNNGSVYSLGSPRNQDGRYIEVFADVPRLSGEDTKVRATVVQDGVDIGFEEDPEIWLSDHTTANPWIELEAERG